MSVIRSDHVIRLMEVPDALMSLYTFVITITEVSIGFLSLEMELFILEFQGPCTA
jgi:hypothetical protein